MKAHDKKKLNWYQTVPLIQIHFNNFPESNFILVDFMPDQVSSSFLQLVQGSYKYLSVRSCQADTNMSKFSHLTWFKSIWLEHTIAHRCSDK